MFHFFPKITEPAICVTRHRSQQVQARRFMGGAQRVDLMDFPRFYQLELGTRCSVHLKDGWYESWLRSASQGNILKDYVCISESRVCGLWLCPDMVILLQYGNYETWWKPWGTWWKYMEHIWKYTVKFAGATFPPWECRWCLVQVDFAVTTMAVSGRTSCSWCGIASKHTKKHMENHVFHG